MNTLQISDLNEKIHDPAPKFLSKSNDLCFALWSSIWIMIYKPSFQIVILEYGSRIIQHW